MSDLVRYLDPITVDTLDFYNPSKRELRIFYTRDKHAQLNIYGALSLRGRRLGESILNLPPPGGWKPGDRLYETAVELGPRHELLVTTRPPLDDELHGEPKQVLRGYTEIEWRVLQAVRPYFAHLSRSQVRLAKKVKAKLLPGFEPYANGVVYQRNCAWYQEFPSAPHGHKKPERLTTPAFLLRKRRFTRDGATLLLAFGMDGTAGLIWSYLLARVHSDWLFQPGFRMVQLSGPALPERPTDLRFALDWKAEEIVHLPA